MNMRLGYPMQLGSGTFDLLPGLTYFVQKDESSWGAQVSSVIRMGENSENYSFGNGFMATVWYAHKLSNLLSASVRIKGNTCGKINGQDRRKPERAVAQERVKPSLVAREAQSREGSSASASGRRLAACPRRR